MAKQKTTLKTVYICNHCGAQLPKWSGQCGECKSWNTLEETSIAPALTKSSVGYAGEEPTKVQRLSEVKIEEIARYSTGLQEFDRSLGSGLVLGSVVLIGGDPGIGKSTLLLQVLMKMATQQNCLYVTGEESTQQVSMRAQRLGLTGDQLLLLPETCIERILQHARQVKPQIMVVDSIQTIYTEQLSSAPGSVGQVRESAMQLTRYAKQNGVAIFLVGHVTKEGAIAGPRVLEHMVDTVLYFEGDPGQRYRVLRAVKNRFGPVNEIGVFAMTEQGLREVTNPSAIFLSRHPEPVPGSVIMVSREGTRPLLVEIQALVDESHGAAPRRITLGLEQNRLAMLLAVLHRHAGVAMYGQDVYVNAVGGVRVMETGADLAILTAAISSFRNWTLSHQLVVFGEVGLAGEVRPVPNGEERLKEAAKHGFTHAIIPKSNLPKKPPAGMHIVGITRLEELMAEIRAS